MIIADLMYAMRDKNHEALAACFSDTCRLFDYCPQGIGRNNSFLYGSRAVDMYYHHMFVLGGLSILDPRIENERNINFYSSYAGVIVHAIASIETYDAETGRIKEMVIRPA